MPRLARPRRGTLSLVNREQRREWRRDTKRRKLHRATRGTDMLAKKKWQIKTIAVLEKVFEERERQMAKHGAAMEQLPDGVGPDTVWVEDTLNNGRTNAAQTQVMFRRDYELAETLGGLTRMHLVREELAEAFELDGDSPEFLEEILQVAALCVQWAEYKIDNHGNHNPEDK